MKFKTLANSGSLLLLLVTLSLAYSFPAEETMSYSELIQAGIHVLEDALDYNNTQSTYTKHDTQVSI